MRIFSRVSHYTLLCGVHVRGDSTALLTDSSCRLGDDLNTLPAL